MQCLSIFQHFLKVVPQDVSHAPLRSGHPRRAGHRRRRTSRPGTNAIKHIFASSDGRERC